MLNKDEKEAGKQISWTICAACLGRGKKSRRIRKKTRLSYQKALDLFKEMNREGIEPVQPKGHLYNCLNCAGSGLMQTDNAPKSDIENLPHVAIIGGGIGGVALAVACMHRGIPFTLFERDNSFNVRSQGYGLTLQQASKAIEGLGLFSLKEGVVSTRHLVHTTSGEVIGEWGMRKWMDEKENSNSIPRRTNIHIARQALRSALIDQLGGNQNINWGHQLMDLKINSEGKVELSFQVEDEIKHTKADLVVGADGIRSTVRRLIIGEKSTPLRYLGCMVILGICPLDALTGINTDLLDSATVFQTANGNERIYIMPFDSKSVMWQLSFPMLESEAKELSSLGIEELKKEASLRTKWHEPIPQIIASTKESEISGYPVYDRDLIQPEVLEKAGSITLIGDAAHPMSPFKGQGANQAILDAIALARGIFKVCNSSTNWRKEGIRKNLLTEFETEMLERSAVKVKDSAEAVAFLHSETVLHEGDEPRGRCLKRDRP